jgi:hypothetical protein
MRLDSSGVLHAKSQPKWYEMERDGFKPNTVRVMTEAELADAREAHSIMLHNTVDPAATFIRTIDGVFDMTDMLPRPDGCRVVVICWTHPAESG